MKKIIFPILILLAFTTAMSQKDNKIQWKPVQEALDMNKAGKFIFIDFYTTWCGWCTRMDQTTFIDTSVVSFMNEHFIPVKFNAETSDSISYNGKKYGNPFPGRSRSANEFTYAVLGPRVGYPSFAVLDENNSVILIIPGYQQPAQLLNALKYVQTKSYLTKTWQEWNAEQQ